MSPSSHKSEYTILLVLAILSVLVLLALMWQGLVHEDRSGRSGVRTTRSTNVDGMLVCYMLFERLGIPVERSHSMLLANRIEKADVIFLIDPIQPLNPGEIMDLGAWIERGGVLVASDRGDQLKDLDPAMDLWVAGHQQPTHPLDVDLAKNIDILGPLAKDAVIQYWMGRAGQFAPAARTSSTVVSARPRSIGARLTHARKASELKPSRLPGRHGAAAPSRC